MENSTRYDDNAFGPQYGNSFDFTLRFENTILTIVPASILIALFPYLLYHYAHQPILVARSWHSRLKTVIATSAACVELADLVIWTQQTAKHSVDSIAASALYLVAALCIIGIIDFEHRHALRSSSVLGFYLLFTLLFDATRARSYFQRGNLSTHTSLAATSAALKGVLLFLGEASKRLQIRDPDLRKSVGSESTSGFLNRSLFLWLNQTFAIGFRKALNLKDLQQLGPEFSSAHLGDKFTALWSKADKSSPQCLLKALLSVLAKPLFASVIPRLCNLAIEFVAPFYLKRVVEFVGQSDQSRDHARGLIGATVLIFAGRAISMAMYKHLSYRLVTLTRGVLVSQILMKGLQMDYIEASKNSAMTLMSTDIESLIAGLEDIHDTWLSFVQVGVGTYLLTTIVGRATFLVVIPITLSFGGALFISRRIMPAQTRWNEKIQHRVSKTVQVFKNLRGIKMLGLESVVGEYLQNVRVDEINESKPYRFWTATNLFIVLIAIVMTPVLVIAGAIFWSAPSGRLSASEAYATLAIVMLISNPLMSALHSYSSFASTVACVQRIQQFLLLEEVKDQRSRGGDTQKIGSSNTDEKLGDSKATHDRQSHKTCTDEFAMRLDRVAVKSRLNDRLLLENITFDVVRSKFSIIFGPVGSGKSVLLKTLLGEVNFEGSIYVDAGAIAYCDQLPWLQNCSIRQNIIGEKDFDLDWYETVTDLCLLRQDFMNIAGNDEALAGSNGVSLSGGQKQRVALARALYSRAAIFVLDDILSGLDAATARAICSNLFGNHGIFRRLQATVIMATHTVHCAEFADQLLILDSAGHIQVQSNTGLEGKIDNANLARFQGLPSQTAQSESQKTDDTETLVEEKVDELAVAQEDALRRKGSGALYKLYFQSAKRWMAMTFLATCILSGVTEVFPAVYYRIWLGTDADNDLYFIGYAGIAILACFIGTGMNFFFFVVVVPDSSNALHRMLLKSMMGATLSFLTSTDAGTILNRFSQDMTILTQVLPRAALQVFYFGAIALVQLAVSFSGATYAAAVVPLMLLVIYAIQHFYLRTSRQMRYLDLEAKTPLYTHINETASGLYHIRSYGITANTYRNGLKLLDTSQMPYYYMFCIQRWLGLTMDLTATAVAAFIVCLALLLPKTATPPGFGLAMLSMFAFGEDMSLFIEKWTAIETSLGALARLRSFTRDTPLESSMEVEAESPPQHWPDSGHIVVNNMDASYSSTDTTTCVLRNISLDIPAGQKVGIVGRTGSGKSSLILALLNFLELTGSVHIDDVDITKLSRTELRSRITTIPQDPVELDGSVRDNLDPFRQETESTGKSDSPAQFKSHDDADVIDVLTEIRLWDYIQSHGGLDASMADMAFSSGQKQLLCIARAILHNRNSRSKVVLMDEPTSNVDVDSDKHVQQVMAKSFCDCTVLSVAHRLETIQDADMIIEIVDGSVARVLRPNSE